MTRSTSAYVVVPGGTSHVVTLGGALYAIDERIDVLGVGGVSAGGLNAAALAFNIDAGVLLATYERLLAENRILDRSMFALTKYGLCSWDVLGRAVVDMFGADARLGDALIPLFLTVTDASTGMARYLSSWYDPRVKLVEACRATSAIVPLACMQYVNGRLAYDGGFSDNFPDHIFQDRPEPTVALRLKVHGDDQPIHIENAVGAAKSVGRALSRAVSTPKNKRPDTVYLDVHGEGSGFDFDLTPAVTQARWGSGRKSITTSQWYRGLPP